MAPPEDATGKELPVPNASPGAPAQPAGGQEGSTPGAANVLANAASAALAPASAAPAAPPSAPAEALASAAAVSSPTPAVEVAAGGLASVAKGVEPSQKESPAKAAPRVLPPYGDIAWVLRKGNAVPFLGAGASLVGREKGERFDPRTRKFLPNARELSEFLADNAQFPSESEADKGDLAKVCSYVEDLSGRKVLKGRLREVLSTTARYGPLHETLAALPRPLVLVTTNYDSLIEDAFVAAGREFDLLVYPDTRKLEGAVLYWRYGEPKPQSLETNKFQLDLDDNEQLKRTLIFKMHGSLWKPPGTPAALGPEEGEPGEGAPRDHYVITEEDYVEFLSRMTGKGAIPPALNEYFRPRNFLFLGYGLRDWNTRVLLKNLGKKQLVAQRVVDDDEDEQDVRSWAIQKDPTVLEVQLWQKRNVRIFNDDLGDFARKLKAEVDKVQKKAES